MRSGSSIRSAGGAFIKSASGGLQDGLWHGGYGFGTGVLDVPVCMDVQENGMILCGGSFISYYKRPKISPPASVQYHAGGILRLRSNGELDSTFNFSCNLMNGISAGVCLSVVTLSTGEIICGGRFTMACGTAASNVVGLDSNGFLNPSFNTGTGFNGQVNKILKQTDDKIICVGEFTQYNGTACNYIVRLNTDGSIDAGFNTGTSFTGIIRTAYLLASGSIMCVGGSYTGTTSTLILLTSDGNRDLSFDYVPAPPGYTSFSVPSPLIFAVAKSGKFLVGERFPVYRPYPNIWYYSILRLLNSNGTYTGTQSQAFIDVPKSGSGFSSLYSLYVMDSGNILCGGYFNECGGANIWGIALFNSSLSRQNLGYKVLDRNLDKYVCAVRDIRLQRTDYRSVDKILICGNFIAIGTDSVNYNSRWGIARLNADLSVDKYQGETT
jgi:uncharacterized delta-60 repeat protein